MEHRPLPPLALNLIAVAAGILTFCAGVAWVVYGWIVDHDPHYFAIPLVFSVPVIVAVAIRSILSDRRL